jgi:hypothetical protein
MLRGAKIFLKKKHKLPPYHENQSLMLVKKNKLIISLNFKLSFGNSNYFKSIKLIFFPYRELAKQHNIFSTPQNHRNNNFFFSSS